MDLILCDLKVQFGWKVFLSGAHETFDGNDRRLHHSRRPLAGQEDEPSK